MIRDCACDLFVGIAFQDSLEEILKYISNPTTQDYVIQKYIGMIFSVFNKSHYSYAENDISRLTKCSVDCLCNVVFFLPEMLDLTE